MSDKKYTISEADRLAMEVMCYSYLINRFTDLCVFNSLSGHVEWIETRICPDKKRYHNEIAASTINTGSEYMAAPSKETIAGLTEKVNVMKQMLHEKEVPTDQMYEVVHRVITYAF